MANSGTIKFAMGAGKIWHSVAQFCSDMNIPYRRFYQRIKRGMSVEKAVNLG